MNLARAYRNRRRRRSDFHACSTLRSESESLNPSQSGKPFLPCNQGSEPVVSVTNAYRETPLVGTPHHHGSTVQINRRSYHETMTFVSSAIRMISRDVLGGINPACIHLCRLCNGYLRVTLCGKLQFPRCLETSFLFIVLAFLKSFAFWY